TLPRVIGCRGPYTVGLTISTETSTEDRNFSSRIPGAGILDGERLWITGFSSKNPRGRNFSSKQGNPRRDGCHLPSRAESSSCSCSRGPDRSARSGTIPRLADQDLAVGRRRQGLAGEVAEPVDDAEPGVCHQCLELGGEELALRQLHDATRAAVERLVV